MADYIDRQAAIEALNEIINKFEQILRDIRESKIDDSVCGMCEYDGAYIGESGNWCNECPGFDKDDCFKLSDEFRKRWLKSVDLPSVEVAPVKRGKWMHDNRKHIRCSECGNELPIQAVIFRGETVYEYGGENNYCPNCGAKMESEK